MKSSRSVVSRSIKRPPKQEPVLWVVDSEQWPRACLRAELIERGYDPYGFIRVTDALDSLAGGSSPKPAAIVLELRGQELTNELIESIRNLAVPTFLLGGSAELNQSVIRKHSWDMVVKRPFSLGHLADLIERVVKKDLQKEGQNP